MVVFIQRTTFKIGTNLHINHFDPISADGSSLGCCFRRIIGHTVVCYR